MIFWYDILDSMSKGNYYHFLAKILCSLNI